MYRKERLRKMVRAPIEMCTALVSVLANVPVKADVALTGEIALRGQVLQIGGLKEKLSTSRIKTVIIPEENVPDLKEIPDNESRRYQTGCLD